jgi:hypothetical protein
LQRNLFAFLNPSGKGPYPCVSCKENQRIFLVPWGGYYEKFTSVGDFSLDSLLPKVGEKLTLTDSGYEKMKNGRNRLLWLPPLSNYNDFEEHPSEILESYVLKGEVSEASEIGFWETKFDFYVEEVTLFTDYLGSAQPTQCGQFMRNGKDIMWDEAEQLRKAEVGSFIYLTGQGYYGAILTTILKRTSQNYEMLFHEYSPSAPGETVTMKYLLKDNEQILFERLIEEADSIVEVREEYLC